MACAFSEEGDGVVQCLWHVAAVELLARPQVQFVGARVRNGARGDRLPFAAAEPDGQAVRRGAGDALLDGEHLLHRAVVLHCPEVCIQGGIDQLAGDAEIIIGPANAALEHITHGELVADRTDALRGAAVLERRRPRDHPQRADARQVRRDSPSVR
jgi:hypothetical protein